MNSDWDGRERRRGLSAEQLRERLRAARLDWEALHGSPCQDDGPVGIRVNEPADPSRKQQAAEAEEQRRREQRVREIREEHQDSQAKTIK
jgi:hypothetical protein